MADDWLDRKKPTTAPCEIALDPEAVEVYEWAKVAHSEAMAALELAEARARLTPGLEVPADLATAVQEAEAALDKARGPVEAGTMVFRFRALSRGEFRALKDEYPPTPAQIATAKAERRSPPQFDPDTFFAALVAASCVDPPLSLETVRERIWDSPAWSDAELEALSMAAWRVNETRRVPELGKGSGPTPS